MMARKKKPVEERFWAKVEKTESCWIWTAAKDRYGYGAFGIDYRTRPAHRVAVELVHGALPDQQLDHTCHNRACVNPDHLRPVDHKQNQEHRDRLQSNNRSGYQGVSRHSKSGRWLATVMHNRKQMFLGLFYDPAEAGAVAAAKRKELFTHNDADRHAA